MTSALFQLLSEYITRLGKKRVFLSTLFNQIMKEKLKSALFLETWLVFFSIKLETNGLLCYNNEIIIKQTNTSYLEADLDGCTAVFCPRARFTCIKDIEHSYLSIV